MPISNEALENIKNRFIAVKGEATVAQALAALQALGGQTWWHLLVQTSKDAWGITRVGDLCQGLETTPTDSAAKLGDWPGLLQAKVVEQQSMETRAAQTLAKKSPGAVLVVTDGAMPLGILFEGVSRNTRAVPTAKLGDLCGKYVNLKDYGSILLASSKKAK
jgi:hypothetical protein